MAVVSQRQNADKERLGNFATSSPGVRLVGTVRAVLVGSDHVDTIIWLLAAAAVITATSTVLARIMAIPGVVDWTQKYLPWLAPEDS